MWVLDLGNDLVTLEGVFNPYQSHEVITEIHNSSPKPLPASSPPHPHPCLRALFSAFDLPGGDTIYEAHAVCAYHQPRVPGYCL